MFMTIQPLPTMVYLPGEGGTGGLGE